MKTISTPADGHGERAFILPSRPRAAGPLTEIVVRTVTVPSSRAAGDPRSLANPFVTAWNNRTVDDLYDTTRQSMPQNEPNSLGAHTYLDVVAFLLETNRFPTGAELSGDRDLLKQITITWTKP